MTSDWTAEKLKLAHMLGLRANAFFADAETGFAFIYNLGTPGIMTNAPARLVEWLAMVDG